MKDMTGQKFGRLTAIKPVGRTKDRQIIWRCRCDCGKIHDVDGHTLRRGQSKSCGCLNIDRTKQRFTKHGLCGHPLYETWNHMKNRCVNKTSNHGYIKDYRDRGISVCNEWLDFANFLKWAEPRWKKGLLIDRINNDEGYCPENCRFVTDKISMRNTRRSKYWFLDGRKFDARIDAAKFFDVSPGTIKKWCDGLHVPKTGRYYPPKPGCWSEYKYPETALRY